MLRGHRRGELKALAEGRVLLSCDAKDSQMELSYMMCKVRFSPKNDTPDPNYMQKQGAFYSAEIHIGGRGGLSFQDGEISNWACRPDLKHIRGSRDRWALFYSAPWASRPYFHLPGH